MQYLEYAGSFVGVLNAFTEKKTVVLDPMLTVVKLGLLRYELEGTKVGMSEHGFDLQPPGISQSIYRRFASQGHDDLSVFGETIKKAVFQYKKEQDNEFQKALKVIFENAVKGLENLQKTYPNTTTSQAITTWINHLKGSLKVEPAPHISAIAEKVKAEWRVHNLQDFARWYIEAEKAFEQKATSPTSEKELELALGMIRAAAVVKQLEFERVLFLNKEL